MNKVFSIFLSLTVAIVIASPSYSADPTPQPLPPDYVAPLPSQFNSDGALAFRPDGTPLAGFNADGSPNLMGLYTLISKRGSDKEEAENGKILTTIKPQSGGLLMIGKKL